MDQQPKKQTPSKSQIMYDPMIIPRVKQYLEENVHQRYLDVGVMSRMLQERYREYSRRKSAPFRQLVEQAYKTVLHSYGLDSNPSSDDNDEVGSDLEVMEERPDLMNSMLTSLYTDNRTPAGAAAAPAAGPAVVQDSIDISSDDDDDDSKADSSSKASKTATVAKNAAAAADNADNAPKKSSNKSASGGSVQRHGNTIITVVPAAQTVDGDSPAAAGALADGTTAVAGLASPVPKKRKTHHVDELNAKLNAALPYAQVRMQEMMQAYNTLTNDSSGKKAGLLGAKPRRPSSSNAIAGPAPPPSAVNGAPAVLANATNASAARSTARKYKREFLVQDSTYNFDDVGGLERILMELCELLLHIKHPEVYRHIGLPPPRGFLLHGPPGCGKTLLAQAIAGQLDVCMIQVAATELVAGVSGESEERIRELFEQAAAVAPCVLFIDEIDAISSNRQHAQKDMERRIVAQLLSCLDGLSKHPHGDQVLIIGATNRADTLDPALRRVGRFDQEISLGIPDRHAREHILRVICTNLKLTQPFDYDWIAALTPGYVGADLLALATRAASIAVKRAFSAKADLELRQIGARREANLAREAAKLRALYGPNEALQTVNLLDDSAMEEGPVEETVGEKTVADVIAVEPEVAVNGEQVATEVAEKSQEDVEPQVVGEPDADVEPVATDVVPEPDVEPMDTDKTVDVEPMDTDKAAEVEKEQSAESTDSAAVTNTEENKDTEKTETEDNGSNKTADEAKSPDNDEVPEIAEPETTPFAEVAEQITPAPANAEVAATIEPTATEPAVEAAATQPTAAPQAAAAIVDEIVDLSDDETLSEALLKNPTVRLSLTLDEMVGWLSATDPIIDSEEIRDLAITMADFCEAVKLVQPSAKREGFITVPDVTWDDIGALRDIREELQLAVLAPVRYPQKLEALGLKSPSGVLLCGPPGCGKTLLAKAVANEAGINFISVKGPELLNMYVGESERAVRQCFQRARNSAPCVIFFDEFDALCPTRSGSSENTSSSRVVNQLLTEMDGVEERKGVFLMAATNRPDIVDPAVLRPGRLDKILYVGLPGERERAEILEALTKTKPKLGNDVSYTELAALTENFTGADLAGLVRQASLQALKDSIADALAQPDGPGQKKAVVADDQTDPIRVHRANFVRALTHIRPSVSEEDKRHYLRLQKKYTVMPATPPEV